MLRIDDLRRRKEGRAYVASARLCLTADGRVVACDDVEAATLLVGEGGEIPWSVAARYGLVADEATTAQAANKPAPRVRAKRVRDDRLEDKGA